MSLTTKRSDRGTMVNPDAVEAWSQLNEQVAIDDRTAGLISRINQDVAHHDRPEPVSQKDVSAARKLLGDVKEKDAAHKAKAFAKKVEKTVRDVWKEETLLSLSVKIGDQANAVFHGIEKLARKSENFDWIGFATLAALDEMEDAGYKKPEVIEHVLSEYASGLTSEQQRELKGLLLKIKQPPKPENFNAGIDFSVRQSTPAAGDIFERTADGKKKLHCGWFDKPFENANVEAAGNVFQRIRNWVRSKRWQYVSFSNEKYTITMAAADLRYMSNFFLMVYDKKTGECIAKFSKKALGGGAADIAAGAVSGKSSFKAGDISYEVNNHYKEGYYEVSFSCKDDNGNQISADKLRFDVDGDALVNNGLVGKDRMVHTVKLAGKAGGTVRFVNNGTDENIGFSSDNPNHRASFDYTAGLHRYKTGWNWASGDGKTADGQSAKIDISSATAAGVWIAGTYYRAGEVDFDYDDVQGLWHIRSKSTLPNGAEFDLVFTPKGKASESVDVGVIAAKYTQLMGTYSGTITVAGKAHEVELSGVTEQKTSKW